MMTLLSFLGQASASKVALSLRYWRASHPSISSVENRFLSCTAPFARFSTVSDEQELLQQIQTNFGRLTPHNELSVPDPAGFPLHIDTDASLPIRLTQNYCLEEIAIHDDKIYSTSLKRSGLIFNKRDRLLKFRMHVVPDCNNFDVISISDKGGGHVGGSTKYLESKGINSSTIRMLFDYLKNREIPSKDEFPLVPGHEHLANVFGRFNESQVKEAKDRLTGKYGKMVEE